MRLPRKGRRKRSHCLDWQWPPYSGMAEHRADADWESAQREGPARPAIQLIGVDKWFGAFQVLKNINLAVAQGREDRHLRPFGLGQVDADPLHQPSRGASGRPHRRRRRGADQRPAPDRQGARGSRHGVPELQPVPAPHRARQSVPGPGVGEEDAARGGREAGAAIPRSRAHPRAGRQVSRASSRAASSSAWRSRGRCA